MVIESLSGYRPSNSDQNGFYNGDFFAINLKSRFPNFMSFPDNGGAENCNKVDLRFSFCESGSGSACTPVTIPHVTLFFVDFDQEASSSSVPNDKSVEQVYDGWRDMAPEGRLGRPEELAAAIAFLASPEAAFVRGICMPVDGGRLRSI